MKITIIGAAGFIGQRIATLLLAHKSANEIRLVDQIEFQQPPGTRAFTGHFTDNHIIKAALHDADVIIMLASVLGGAAESNPVLARKINIDATLDLIDYLQQRPQGPRLVFASTVAVYGGKLESTVTDDTRVRPRLLYGAHKLMIEALLSTLAERKWLDAVSLRPAGVVARADVSKGLKSAFISELFHAVRNGMDITLPVEPHHRTWLASVDNVARNFVHAATLPELGHERALTLPALCLSYGELVEALKSAFPNSRSVVSYEADAETVALFGQYPALQTNNATQLGFTRDEDIQALIKGAF